MVKIRIADIPPEGKDISFELPKLEMNARLGADREARQKEKASVSAPSYSLEDAANVELNLQLEGSTVVAKGRAKARYVSTCARCAEETSQSVEVPIDVILKHASARNRPGAEEEDLHLSYYEGLEINCSDFTADLLLLAIPFAVLCKEDCKGLCPQCGKNLNLGACECKPDRFKDPRLAALGQIKLTH